MAVPAPDWIHIPLPGDHYSPRSGSSYGTVIYELTRRHDENGCRSRVIVGRGTLDGYPPYDAGEVVEVPHGRYPGRYGRLADALTGCLGLGRKMKWRGYSACVSAVPANFPGWVFVHGEPAIVGPIRTARPAARIALYCHYELFNWYCPAEVRRILAKCSAVICVSRHIREYVVAKAGRAGERLHVVPNGIDTDVFHPSKTAPAGDPVILYVGRVEPEKGVHLLVAACRKLIDRGIRFRLHIVGGKYLSAGAPAGEYQRQVAEQAKAMGDRVLLTPFVDRTGIPAVYQSATVFCAPSVWDEPFGLTVAEAMAAGVPVVVSRRGALPDVAGEAGTYFDPPDATALADRLAELLGDAPRRKILAAAGRARAMTFGWDRVYKQLVTALGDR